ncbi:MAG: hypothetical protein ACRD13_10320, partial [Terriglobales bacterium]
MGSGSKWLLSLAVFALAPGCVLGQTASFHTSVSRVLVPVTVTSHQGRAITGLGPRDFQIFVDGRRVPVRSVDWISAASAGSRAAESAAGRSSSSAAGRSSSPGIFANARRPAPVSWVVLLVDFQNTQLDDMKWMR